MDSAQTLLLNQGFEPIKVISWQRAISLLFLGKVEVLEEYDRDVRSVNLIIKVPAVVRLEIRDEAVLAANVFPESAAVKPMSGLLA